jgi:Zn-dependent peptidase ImmA (M78 family)
MLLWARERARMSIDGLVKRFPKIELWERGEAQPTLKQLERFAKATFVPIGYLFLPQPPIEEIPIPDFRTVGSQAPDRPSPNLLETVYLCQQRQSWYREYARNHRTESLPFVASVGLDTRIDLVAERMRQALRFDLDARRDCSTWTDALRDFITQADEIGVMVMCSGVVRNNNRRRLDPQEFRGFAIADNLAPLVFINGADTKAAQMFTLAHELAHLWLGQTGLSNSDVAIMPEHNIERWCNEVAAELLVPLIVLRNEYRPDIPLIDEMNRLARQFKVSTLVILRRILDANYINRIEFQRVYEEELRRLTSLKKGSGGDFYLTQYARVSKRFARALVESTLEGQTLYRDAFRMLGFSKVSTFNEMGRKLGYWL